MRVPLYVTSCFSSAAVKILSLSLTFNILIIMCIVMGLPRFVLFGALGFLDIDVCFFPYAREVFRHYFFKYVFCPFLSSPGTPTM